MEQKATMNLRRIIFSGVRLVAVYVFAQGMYHLPQTAWVAVGGGSIDASGWSFIIGFILMMCTAILLWTRAGWFARTMARGSDEEALGTPLQMEALELMAFALLGTFILVNAIPRLAFDIAQLIAPNTFDRFLGPDGPSDNYRAARLLEAAGTLVRVLVGSWLLLGTRSFVGWLRKMRQRGLDGPAVKTFDDEKEE